ncbi:MAG: response regulator [Atopobiaceae bacterium]|nr:response regulator [Atopobiaceae bacterium]
MANHFGETLSRLRTKRGLSQQELADRLHVTRSAVANWEAGHRMPAASTIMQIAQLLDVEVALLLATAIEPHKTPNVVLVDDNPIALEGMLPVLQEALPGANVIGLSGPAEALDYFVAHPVALAFLDIELGKVSGLNLCQELLRIQPNANVVFLTAYREYSLDAWGTDACGYLLKPLAADEVRKQIPKLRHPVSGLL